MDRFEYWLAQMHGISGRRKSFLREQVSTPEILFYMEETGLLQLGLRSKEAKSIRAAANREMLWQVEKEIEQMYKKGIRMVTCKDEGYPERFCLLTDMPYAVFVRGTLPPKGCPAAAIVGARACSSYGRKYALEYGRELAKAGVAVVSGMALGIDGAAQRGALIGGGHTVAVLGCGPDICYPKEHSGLYLDILEGGGAVLSEYGPGTKPFKSHFPARNRIISALSDAVLVMEARKKSGSLITVDMALEQGKEVYALPGAVDSELSYGCNSLISQGAGVLLSVEKLLEDVYGRAVKSSAKEEKEKIMLETPENMVYSCLRPKPKNLQQLLQETGMPIQDLVTQLMALELSGRIEEVSKNYYRTLE